MVVTEKRMKEVRMVLEETKKEAEELIANILILLEKLDEIKTSEDADNWDDLSYELLTEFSHLKIF